jgi:hypothetical protein
MIRAAPQTLNRFAKKVRTTVKNGQSIQGMAAPGNMKVGNGAEGGNRRGIPPRSRGSRRISTNLTVVSGLP